MSQHLSSTSNKGREISQEGMSLCVRCVPGDASADLIAVFRGGGVGGRGLLPEFLAFRQQGNSVCLSIFCQPLIKEKGVDQVGRHRV